MIELSPLAVSALGILREGPNHPYEIYRTMLDRGQDRLVKVRPGTLYHAMTRLAEAGLIEVVGTDRAGNRPERTTYAITATGRDGLIEQVRRQAADPVWEYPVFPVTLSELHSLDRADAVAALTRRREVLRAEVERQHEAIDRLTRSGLPPVYWLELTYTHRVLGAEVDWLTELLDGLATGTVDWSDRTTPTSHHPVPHPEPELSDRRTVS